MKIKLMYFITAIIVFGVIKYLPNCPLPLKPPVSPVYEMNGYTPKTNYIHSEINPNFK